MSDLNPDESVEPTTTDPVADVVPPPDAVTEDQPAPRAPESAAPAVTPSEAVEPDVDPTVPTQSELSAPEPATPEAVEPEAAEPETVESETAEPETAESAAPEPETVATEAPTTAAAPEGAEPPSTEPAADGAPAVEPKPKGDAGRVLGGIISAISADEVDLTLDDGRPAVISRRNFDAAGTDPSTVFNPGDRIEGAVLTREDPKNRVVLSRAWAQKRQAWEAVAALAEANELVTVPVTGKGKKGLVVDVQGLRGFVPASHVELEPPVDLPSYVGQSLELKIIDCDPVKERLVLSRRSQLMKEQRKAISGLMSSLVVGETRTGTVASLVDYGAFVDLGGVKGLVHLSELDWSRVRHPKDVVSVGDEIEVKILDVKIKKKRISLSRRQLTPDPFESVPVGEVVVGTVTRLVDFGAFVDVGNGLEGLVHITELAEHRVFAPEEIVTPGEEVRVKVLSVDRKRRRVELSIRQATLL